MAETAKLFDEPIKVLPYPAEAGLSGALFLRNVSKSDDQNADKAASGYNPHQSRSPRIVAINYIQLESKAGQPWSRFGFDPRSSLLYPPDTLSREPTLQNCGLLHAAELSFCPCVLNVMLQCPYERWWKY